MMSSLKSVKEEESQRDEDKEQMKVRVKKV